MRGKVSGYMFNPITGEQRDRFTIHNVITYAAADSLAKLIGGDINYAPKYMGFIYGAGAAPTSVDPPTSRVQTWDGLSDELADAGVTGNIAVAPMTTQPGYAVDGDTARYEHNSVTMVSHTGSRQEYGFATAAPYATALVDGFYLYQAMLLVRRVVGSNIVYSPFARVTLKDGSFPQKTAGYELAVFWSISLF